MKWNKQMPPSSVLRLVGILILCVVGSRPTAFGANAPAAPGEASEDLARHFALLKNEHTLAARFICEKQLAALDTPLVSEGRLWIQKGSNAAEGAVRFSTEKPYVSELILTGGKVLARSQHEGDWTTTNQSTRPGLTAVMMQLGAWSTGNADKLNEMYAVTKSDAKIPNPPEGVAHTVVSSKVETNSFVLTPTNSDMLKAIKQLTLTLDHQDGSLLFLEIQTQQGDMTRYWFIDVKRNIFLPPNVFTPGSEPLVPAESTP